MTSSSPHPNYRYASVLAVAVLLVSSAIGSEAKRDSDHVDTRLSCASTTVTVSSQDIRDAEDLCRGAIAATSFFCSLGQCTKTSIELEAVEQLPSEGNPSAVGCFNRLNRRAYALTYKAFSARGKWLGIPISRQLYQSIATHEVAHALTACTAETYPLATHAAEYVAFAAMFSKMPELSRESVLAMYPDADFASEWQITEVAYGLDPIRFGVAAYRHFRREPDPAALLRAILAGAALTARPHY